MGERPPRITTRQIIKVLTHEGFVLTRQSGSHQIYSSRRTGKRTTVPYHTGSKIIHPKMLKSILKDADLTVSQLRKLL